MLPLVIRKAIKTDDKNLLELTETLGYPVHTETFTKCLNNILNHSEHILLVAENQKTIIGYIHGQITVRLTAKPWMEICGLVVADNWRRKGVATQMIRYLIEFTGPDQRIRVRTNSQRSEAKAMYVQMGFKPVKTQHILDYRD